MQQVLDRRVDGGSEASAPRMDMQVSSEPIRQGETADDEDWDGDSAASAGARPG